MIRFTQEIFIHPQPRLILTKPILLLLVGVVLIVVVVVVFFPHISVFLYYFHHNMIKNSPYYFCTVVAIGRNGCKPCGRENVCCVVNAGLLRRGTESETHKIQHDSSSIISTKADQMLVLSVGSWSESRFLTPLTLLLTDTNTNNFSFTANFNYIVHQ